MADKFVSQSNLSYFWSQVKTKLAGKVDTTDSRLTDSRTPTSHTHGNISNSGAVTATAAIASGDRLLIADSTSSVYGVVGSTLTFGSSTTTYLRNDGTWGTPPDTDTDTHWASSTIVNSTATATSTTTTALTNGNVYLNHIEDGSVKSSHKITGSGATTVTTDTSGNIIITSTGNDTVYTHPSYTAYASGLYKVTVDTLGHVTAATAVAKSDITALGIPSQDIHLMQTVSTANSAYPVLLSSATTTGARIGVFGTGVTINPSTNTVTASIFSGALSGNATTATTAAACSGNSATATKLATARTFTLSGNTTGSVSFDGSGDVTITTTTSSIGSATVGSASTPIYLNAGVPTACTIASGGLSTADRVSGTVVTVASLPTT